MKKFKKVTKMILSTMVALNLLAIPAMADTINYYNYGTTYNTVQNNNGVSGSQQGNSNIPWLTPGNGSQDNDNDVSPSDVRIGKNVAYDKNAGTGWTSLGDNELVYYEKNRQMKNEWKQFPDGYRHFNERGIMDYDKSIDGLWVQEDGTARSKGETLMPFLDGKSGLDYIKHTLNVFGFEYKYMYMDTYNKQEDGKVYDATSSKGTMKYEITIFRYKDRGSFFR